MNNAEQKQHRNSIERSLKGWAFPDFEILANQLDHIDYKSHYTYALNYASYMFEASDLKKEAIIYAYDLGISLSKVPDWQFLGCGVQAWLHNKGIKFSDEKKASLDAKMKRLFIKYEKQDELTKIWSPTPTQERTWEVISQFDGLVDDAISRNVENLKEPIEILNSVGGGIDIEKIKSKYELILAEVKDGELKDNFPDAKTIEAVVKIILKDLTAYEATGADKKAPRKPRKAKKVNPSKMVRKLKYLKSHPELKLTSIEPEKIVGCQVLWIFNTKTRKLGKIVASEEVGLMLKGSTVLNFDEKQSICKKIRKPEEILPKLMNSGKVEQRKLMDTIRAVASPMTGRINKDCILIKVF